MLQWLNSIYPSSGTCETDHVMPLELGPCTDKHHSWGKERSGSSHILYEDWFPLFFLFHLFYTLSQSFNLYSTIDPLYGSHQNSICHASHWSESRFLTFALMYYFGMFVISHSLTGFIFLCSNTASSMFIPRPVMKHVDREDMVTQLTFLSYLLFDIKEI